MQTNYKMLDNNTFATESGQIVLSDKKLRILRPSLYGLGALQRKIERFLGKGWDEKLYIQEQLLGGDIDAAVVMSTSPLLIVAYSEDLDCVAMLRFSESLVTEYDLREGSRLLTVNSYKSNQPYDPDLTIGPNHTSRWVGFHPLIADFLTEDMQQLKRRKRAITEDEWQLATTMGRAYMKRYPDIARDGRPVFASIPAKI